MELPPLPNPEWYAGLYVFDFGGWTSVGYTADEIAVLLGTAAYRQGRAFRIYRVAADGSIELAGVSSVDLSGEEMMLFAGTDAQRSQAEFSALQQLAAEQPAPAPATVELIDLAESAAPHAVCLSYPRHAADAMARWLGAVGFHGGDTVLAGKEAGEWYRRAAGAPLARSLLRSRPARRHRPVEEILARVRDPLQRTPGGENEG